MSVTANLEAAGLGSVEDYAEYVPPGSNPTSGPALYQGRGMTEFGSRSRNKIMFAFGAEFIEVRVHALTGEIRVPRMVGAFAGGRVVNPRTARSQLMGGMIWGMSAGLFEATEVDGRNGRYMNATLHDYYIPVCADIDQIEVQMLSEIDPDVKSRGDQRLRGDRHFRNQRGNRQCALPCDREAIEEGAERLEDLLG